MENFLIANQKRSNFCFKHFSPFLMQTILYAKFWKTHYIFHQFFVHFINRLIKVVLRWKLIWLYIIWDDIAYVRSPSIKIFILTNGFRWAIGCSVWQQTAAMIENVKLLYEVGFVEVAIITIASFSTKYMYPICSGLSIFFFPSFAFTIFFCRSLFVSPFHSIAVFLI